MPSSNEIDISDEKSLQSVFRLLVSCCRSIRWIVWIIDVGSTFSSFVLLVALAEKCWEECHQERTSLAASALCQRSQRCEMRLICLFNYGLCNRFPSTVWRQRSSWIAGDMFRDRRSGSSADWLDRAACSLVKDEQDHFFRQRTPLLCNYQWFSPEEKYRASRTFNFQYDGTRQKRLRRKNQIAYVSSSGRSRSRALLISRCEIKSVFTLQTLPFDLCPFRMRWLWMTLGRIDRHFRSHRFNTKSNTCPL